MTDGTSRSCRHLRRLALAILLAGTSLPAAAAKTADGTETAQPQSSADGQHQDIVVVAPPLFPDIQPERNLDPTAIESYGVSTVDELLSEIQAELGDDEAPLILVNGQRIDDLDEIGAFPVEVLRNLQVLPRGSAVRAGGTSGQRVVSLTLNRKMRTVTTTLAPKIATDGGWHSVRGEALFTKVHGSTRANVAFRMRDDSSLFESERDIVQPDPFRPYSLSGNVIGFASGSGEIDPSLSALAGKIVTVTPVPASSSPSLADFVNGANSAEVTDIGRFRTLRPNSDNYDLNGTFSTRLAPWLSSTATLRLNRSTSLYLRGLPNAVFLLSASNPASPFSRDVGLAFYGSGPLHFRSEHESGEGNLTLNANFGQWTGNFYVKHTETRDTSRSERQSQFGTITLDDSIDPFGSDLADQIPLRIDRTSARSFANVADLTFTGPAVMLPAGPLQATVEGQLSFDRLHSKSTFSTLFGNGDFRRDQQAIRAAVDIPLTSRANGVLPQVGDISGTAEYRHDHFSDAGSLNHYALGVTWEPIPPLRFRTAIENTQAPPSIQVLGNPVIVTPDVRIFDPLTGETVDVAQLAGGNPSLRPQETRLWRIGGLARLLPRLNLELDAEYTDTDVRNFVSSLPDASSAIMLAFPDRFIRDSDGILTTIDLRPVNFASDHEKRLRWGLSMNAKIAGGTQHTTASGKRTGPSSPTTYLQLTANHTIVFSDKITIGPGLDPVDLLGGGAIGIGGGRLRHQVDGTGAITSGGLGARIGVTWRGPSTLESRLGGTVDTLRFSPVFLLNLRTFADMKRIVPRAAWAKGLRLSLDVVNLTNDRQKVRDSFGNAPLQYQPGYRDPLGRTVEFEIRKVF